MEEQTYNDERGYRRQEDKMMEIAIFGTGYIGRQAAVYYRKKGGAEITCFIDNDKEKQGKKIREIEIVSIDEFKRREIKGQVVIAVSHMHRNEIESNLKNAGIDNYFFFNTRHIYEMPRIISYCSEEEMEDVILYCVLKDKKDIFYIDVGANDPVNNSVTKLLYDVKNASGINIEPQKGLYKLLQIERPRDINLNIALGAMYTKQELYLQDGLTTFVADNAIEDKSDSVFMEIVPLSDICKEYASDKSITFLKIDVEGYEREVLLGADLKSYRPELIVIESTKPRTMISSYAEWENIVLDSHYHFVYQKGVNRWYIADEHSEYDSLFYNIDQSIKKYNILRINLKASL